MKLFIALMFFVIFCIKIVNTSSFEPLVLALPFLPGIITWLIIKKPKERV